MAVVGDVIVVHDMPPNPPQTSPATRASLPNLPYSSFFIQISSYSAILSSYIFSQSQDYALSFRILKKFGMSHEKMPNY